MTFPVSIFFTSDAESALQGEQGIQQIAMPSGQSLNVGDEVALLLSPSRSVRRFVCTERLWDFSQTGAPRLDVTLDMSKNG